MTEEKREWLPASEWSESWEEKTGVDSLRDWLKKATRPVYFPPDRRRARRELQDHIDERVEGLQNRGMGLGDARRKVLEMMGDPAETGALLRKVHKPWMGWVLNLARIAALAVLLVAVVMLINGKMERSYYYNGSLTESSYDTGEYRFNYTMVAERSCTCTDQIQFGAFTVSCEEAVCRYDRWETINKETGRSVELGKNVSWNSQGSKCVIRLRFTGAPWYEVPSDIESMIRIVDDKGVEYMNPNEAIGTKSKIPSARRITANVDRTGLTSWQVDIFFLRRPENAAWLDVILGQGASEQKMRVKLGDWQIRDLDSLPEEASDIVFAFQNMELDYNIDSYLPGISFDMPLSRVGDYGPVEEQTMDDMTVSVSKAVYMGYQSDPSTKAENSYQIVDCTLVFRGDTAQLPLLSTMLQERLRIVDPTLGAEAQEITFVPVCTRLYQNLCLWRVVWTVNGDAEHYELQYRQSPEAPACVLRLDLETDVEGEEKP